MTYLVLLAALVLVPTLAVLLLRVNGAIAFMSLCLGSVLVTYTTADVDGVVGGMSAKGASLNTHQWVQLVLLVAPLLFAILFSYGHVKGAKRFTNLLPAVATGLLTALLVVPLLNAGLQRHIHDLPAWRMLSNLQTTVVLGGAVFSLVFLLFTHRSKKGHDDESKKHGKH